MNYYLGLLRFIAIIRDKDGKMIDQINSELTQLVRARNKEEAREALLIYFQREGNGAALLEARINDTVIENGETI